MKIIRIFLFILIIIGIILLFTQKLWVPKLVNEIISFENSENLIPKEVQSDIILVDGRQCYTYSHQGTKEEPYTVNEFLDINIVGKNVTGVKNGMQSGPDMTNGYTGTIAGTLVNNKITSVFSYTIEGSKNKEQEIYQAGLTGIEKLRYPLVEKEGMLVPDTTKEYKTLIYSRVACTASN